jgi:protein-L-isoaspartate(D-aspartate) O-methyltransferase
MLAAMTDTTEAGGGDGPDTRLIELIMHLRNAGIRDTRVLAALERVPRALFVEASYADQSYRDRALPIDCGQTISQPYVVAFMTEKLGLTRDMKVLEIGTGSGYQTAILAHLARRVYTIERYRTLSRQAEERFRRLGLTNIVAIVGDGSKGWWGQAPFDRIIVTAAAPGRPDILIDQLKDDGVLVVPVDFGIAGQQLMRYRKREGGVIDEETLLPVRFVPLVEGVAKTL